MKKYLFARATLAIAVVACNKETDVQQPEKAGKRLITVIAETPETRTVLDDQHNALLWAPGDNFRLMTNTKETGHDAQTLEYVANGKFDAEVSDDATKAYGTNGTNEYSVSMLANASNATEMAKSPYFSRLWYSTGNPTDYPDKQFGKPVTLEFVKPYARVRFIYNYVYPREGMTLGIQEFKPTDGSKIARKGIVTVHYPTDNTKDKEWYTVGAQTGEGSEELNAFTEDFDPDQDTKEYTTPCDNGWYTVIPNLTQGSYTLTVSINNVEKTAVVPAEYMKWLPGYSYTYIFKITDAGGVEIGWVDYKVTPWTDMEVSKSVYNWQK